MGNHSDLDVCPTYVALTHAPFLRGGTTTTTADGYVVVAYALARPTQGNTNKTRNYGRSDGSVSIQKLK